MKEIVQMKTINITQRRVYHMQFVFIQFMAFFILVEKKIIYYWLFILLQSLYIMFVFLLVVFNFFFLQERPDIDDGCNGFSWRGALMGLGCLSKPISGMPLAAITMSFIQCSSKMISIWSDLEHSSNSTKTLIKFKKKL